MFNRVRPEELPSSLCRCPGTRLPLLRGELVPRVRTRPARSLCSAGLGQKHSAEGSSGAERPRRPRPAAMLCSTQLEGCTAPLPGAAAAARTPLPAPCEQRAGCTCVVGDVLEDVLVGHELHPQGAAAAARPLGPAHGGVRHVGAAPPPGGAVAGGRGLAPLHPLTAPLPRDRAPAGSPRPRQRRGQQEAEPGSRASERPSRGSPRGGQRGRRALMTCATANPRPPPGPPRQQGGTSAAAHARVPRARARGRCGDAEPPRAPQGNSSGPALSPPQSSGSPRGTPLTARPTLTSGNRTFKHQQFTK